LHKICESSLLDYNLNGYEKNINVIIRNSRLSIEVGDVVFTLTDVVSTLLLQMRGCTAKRHWF